MTVDPSLSDEGFELLPLEDEPPEGAAELAAQEDAAGTELAPPASPPPVMGRTYALDFERGRFVPEGAQPLALYGQAAMRAAIEKVLRTERGAAPVHDDEYGMEGVEEPEGRPFDEATFAELEERLSDALLALPWVLAVEEFEAEPKPDDASIALVSFRVVPEGDDTDPLDFDNYPLPIP